jgi:hypothetical protein
VSQINAAAGCEAALVIKPNYIERFTMKPKPLKSRPMALRRKRVNPREITADLQAL